MILKIVKKLTKILSLEAIIRLSARLTADILYYGVTHARYIQDPRVLVGVTAVVQTSSQVAKKYKRTNLDPTSIFEDSIDAVIDAF